jgi:hypothetical protein
VEQWEEAQVAEKKVQPVLAISPLSRQSAVTKRQSQRVANTLAAAQAISDTNIAFLTTENESLKRNLGNTLNSIDNDLINKQSTLTYLQSAYTGDLSGTFPELTVVALQGTPIVLTTPAINHIIVHNGTNFINSATIPTHTHVKADVTDFAHIHAGADITTGTINYARLPTGTTASTVAIGDHTHALTGEVTTVGLAATLTNSAVIGKVLTGYTSGAGTVAATDTILQAIQKLNGNSGGPAAAGTLTGATLASGVTASSLTSVGTLASLMTSGTFTLDATALISSPSATELAIKTQVPAGTGVTPTVQIICPSAAFTLTNGTASQSVFDTVQDTVSLQATTTYMVEGQYLLQTGTTSHTTTISFVSSSSGPSAPTFAYTTIASAHSSANAATSTQQTSFFEVIAGGIVANASTLPRTIISFKGILRTTEAGTLVPKLLFSVAPGVTCSTLVGSYLNFYPIGSNTINSVGTAIG